MSSGPAAALLALLVLLAGCAGAIEAPKAAGGPTAAPATDPAGRDRLGWEAGYAHDDPLPVDASDGLTDAELSAYLARTMARVEHLRGHEFTRPVSVEVIDRETLRARVERTGSFAANETLSADRVRVMNAFWEALFFVGEDEDARAVRATESASFLGAYYVFGTDRIRIVTAGPGTATPAIDERLLAHELVHALQDEYAGTPLSTGTDDDEYATAALIEGDAIYLERQYRDRCESGAWDCLSVPPSGGGGGAAGDVHPGFRSLRRFAYSDGPAFVAHVYTNGTAGRTGWAAVDAAFADRPRTTEEIIHPSRYPARTPAPPGRAVEPRDGWRHLGGLYTVGEVEIFGLFWYQAAARGVDVVDPETYTRPDRGEHDRFNYTSVPSAGWDGDRLDVFVRGEETGYVWATRWDTERDAREFAAAYRAVLDGHGARRFADGTWIVPERPFADAFAVERRGRTVTVVNGPTAADLGSIHPPPARPSTG